MKEKKKEVTVSEDCRQYIEEILDTWNDEGSEAREKFEATTVEYASELEARKKAVAESVHLTADDFAVRINAR